ncbi:MAG: hypothetical protein GXO54_02970, partial [Chloroflexi bacterium]|nr:hypothetical protein [Chloroflexota bacterium]
VTFWVYNADPVNCNTQHAEIFLTEAYQPLRASLDRVQMGATPRLAEPYANASHPGNDTAYRALRDALNQTWSARDVAAFLNAVHYGIPLGIVHWFHENPKQVFQGLEKIYQYVLGHAHREAGRFVRPVRLGPDVAPYALAALLSWQLQQRWDFFTAALKCAGATYAQMRDFMDQMYRDHPVILNRFQAERTIQPENVHCPHYPALLAKCGSTQTQCKGTIDRRNFFAHAGFERCAVEVDQANGEPCFRFAATARNTVQRYLSRPRGESS